MVKFFAVLGCLGGVLCGCGGGSGGSGAVNNAPVFDFSASASVEENQNVTGIILNATDQDGDLITYSLVPGGDSSVLSIDPSTGRVLFLIPPDYEMPEDSDVDNIYVATVRASDGKGGVVDEEITISISNVNTIEIQVDSPEESQVLGGVSEFLFSGRVVDIEDGLLGLDVGQLLVDGVDGNLNSESGTWAVELSLEEGEQEVSLELSLTDGGEVNSFLNVRNFPFLSTKIGAVYNSLSDELIMVGGSFVQNYSFQDGSLSNTFGPDDFGLIEDALLIDIVVDENSGIYYAVDFEHEALYSLDPITKDIRVVSSASVGDGPVFTNPSSLVLDSLNGVIYVADRASTILGGTNSIFAVDLSSGNRSIVSGQGVGDGPSLLYLDELYLDDSGGRLLVTGRKEFVSPTLQQIIPLAAVDLGTGDRSSLIPEYQVGGTTLELPFVLDVTEGEFSNQVLVFDLNSEFVLTYDLLDNEVSSAVEIQPPELGFRVKLAQFAVFVPSIEMLVLHDYVEDQIIGIDPDSGEVVIIYSE